MYTKPLGQAMPALRTHLTPGAKPSFFGGGVRGGVRGGGNGDATGGKANGKGNKNNKEKKVKPPLKVAEGKAKDANAKLGDIKTLRSKIEAAESLPPGLS